MNLQSNSTPKTRIRIKITVRVRVMVEVFGFKSLGVKPLGVYLEASIRETTKLFKTNSLTTLSYACTGQVKP